MIDLIIIIRVHSICIYAVHVDTLRFFELWVASVTLVQFRCTENFLWYSFWAIRSLDKRIQRARMIVMSEFFLKHVLFRHGKVFSGDICRFTEISYSQNKKDNRESSSYQHTLRLSSKKMKRRLFLAILIFGVQLNTFWCPLTAPGLE